MDYLGISYGIKNRPALDSGFIPFAPWRSAYLSEAHRPVRIAVERQDGQTAVLTPACGKPRTTPPTCGFWSAPSSCCCGA